MRKTLCNPIKRDCVDRECSLCGVDNVMEQVKGGVEGSDREVTWSRWEKTDTRRKDLVEKSGSMSELIDLLDETLRGIRKHIVVACPLAKEKVQLLEGKPASWACHADSGFCRELSLQIPKRSPKCALVVQAGERTSLCIFFIDVVKVTVTKQRQNMSHFCLMNCDMILISQNAYFKIAPKKMKNKGVAVLHIFSDGCSSQYKSRFTFQNL